MTTQQDIQLGIKKEPSFAVYATPDAFYEINSETLDSTPTFKQGNGLRVGRRIAAANRRQKVKEEVGGSFELDIFTKGMGKLFEAALGGSGTSTLVSGSAYQQLFTPTATDYLDSYTIQKGMPPLGGGALLPHSFLGMVCGGFQFSLANADLPTITFDWQGKSLDTATALAAASYLTGVEELSFIHASLALGGVVTPPTTTVLGSGGTAVNDVSDFNLEYANNLDSGGFNIGSAGQRSRKPALGLRGISGTMTAEFDTVTLRDAFINQTPLPMRFRLEGLTPISGAVYPALEFTFPRVLLEGELPKSNAGDVITQSVGFTVLGDDVSVHPAYVAIRTAETSI